MRPHLFSVRVYYEDTDFSGAVYHANYARFMERGRTEMLRALGVEQGAAMAGEAFGFVVRSIGIEFLKPARMDDLLTVETTPVEIGGATMTLDQRVSRGGEILATARVRVACVVRGKAGRMPREVREKLARGLPEDA